MWISWPGRVLRTPAGRLPPAHLLTHRVSGDTCQWELTSLPFQTSRCAQTSRLPSSRPLCPSRWRCPVFGDAAECEDYLTCQHADHLQPRSPRTRERHRGTPKAPWTAATVRERIPGHAEPGRVGIIRPCAPYDPPRRTRSFPVGRSLSPVVGDHALSSELSLITLYRTYGTEMISTLADMINPYVSSLGRTTEEVAEPIHLISIAAN